MDEDSTTATEEPALFAGPAWFDPIEAGVRERIRGFIEELVEQELTGALGRQRHERGGAVGHRHGHRERRLTGSFGPVEIAVPRARLRAGDGATREWRSAVLPRYARMTRQVEALIAGAYLAGTNTRRVKRALAALFRGAVGKDVVSRAWRKVRTDWEAWCRRDLAGEDVVRLVLDGTVVRVRLDRKATPISLLVVLGIRRDGQKALLAVRRMGGEGEAAWRAVLDDLVARRLRTPEFLTVDGAAGLERALAALWPAVPAQRCTVQTVRTQSLRRSGRAAAARRRWAQGDDMADLQPAVADDDALDQQLQDRLPVGEAGLVEAVSHTAAELRQVGADRLGLQPLLA
jgi:transposase-like protein